MIDVGINHTDLGNRHDFWGVNYRNPNQLAHTESPLCHLLSSYWSCKTQIILPLCEVFINSCLWISVAFICVPQVFSLIPPTSMSKNYMPRTMLWTLQYKRDFLPKRDWLLELADKITLGLVHQWRCAVQRNTVIPPLSVPWSCDLLELPHVPQPATDHWRQDLGPAPAAEHTTDTQCLFSQQKNKTTQKQTNK